MPGWQKIAEAIANLVHAGGDVDDIATLMQAPPNIADLSRGCCCDCARS